MFQGHGTINSLVSRNYMFSLIFQGLKVNRDIPMFQGHGTIDPLVSCNMCCVIFFRA